MILDILQVRQNARIVILAPTEERVIKIEKWLFENLPDRYRFEFCRAGDDDYKQKQILTGTPASFRKWLRRCGPCDVLIVDDCYNLLPMQENRKYVEILSFFRDQNPSITIKIFGHSPLCGISDDSIPVRMWKCGQDYLTIKIEGLQHDEFGSVQLIGNSDRIGCGMDNEETAYCCRNCGRFRGLLFKAKGR